MELVIRWIHVGIQIHENTGGQALEWGFGRVLGHIL